MIRALFLSTLLLLCTCNIYAQKTWAQHERYASQNEAIINGQSRNHKQITAVLLGNSITDHWAKIHPEFFRENNFIGRGISGQVTSQMLCRFQADVIALRPKMVIIMAGTNDIAQNNGYITLQHILQNIQSMCDLARKHRIKPILCTCLPAIGFTWRPELRPAEDIKQLNRMIQAYAKQEKIQFIDYYSALVDEHGGLPKQYAEDGVHPNMAGYTIMEKILLKNL